MTMLAKVQMLDSQLPPCLTYLFSYKRDTNGHGEIFQMAADSL